VRRPERTHLAAESARPLVMLIEDDLDNLESIADLLQEEGYDVVTARTGKEASERLPQTHPCVIIVDYLLPDTNGTELVLRLRREVPGPPVPVIFLTATIDPIDSIGAPIVKKPIVLAEFLDVLGRACGSTPAPS
jgi:CheY-like chemotaxis protein